MFLFIFCLFNQGRISQDFEHFLIAPYGMMHHEVTASSLVKVDMRGDILDLGSTTLGANKTGFSLHSAIYASRPDVKCIIHVRSTSAVSVRAMTSDSCLMYCSMMHMMHVLSHIVLFIVIMMVLCLKALAFTPHGDEMSEVVSRCLPHRQLCVRNLSKVATQ